MFTDTASSKVTAAHLSRTALLYVRQSTLKQVINNTESAIRQYDLRGRAIALGWAAGQITVIDIDQGHSGASAADREGFQQLVAEVSLGRAGIILGLECSRLARNSADWHQLLELCGMTGTLICDEDGLYDPRNFNDRLLLGMKGQMSEAKLHFIKARLRGGIVSKARRGELITPLPVGLVYDAAGHVILDPDTAVRGALAHLFATFEATGSATACVKAFNAAGLSFPWRHRAGPRKGEIDWKPLATTSCCGSCTTPAMRARSPSGGTATSPFPAGSCPAPRCRGRNGSPSSPARTPDTSPWTSTTPTAPGWPPTPPRTAGTGPPGRPARDPRCCRASSSAGPAGSA
jgi:DNA invertase Pin-like site-specific DNA recombinase